MSRPPEQLVDLIRDVPRLWRSLIDRRLRPLGLSQAKWRVLAYASRQTAPVTQTELADFLGIETPTLVRLLDRLTEGGWVQRKACPGDRRVRRVHLTPKAQRVTMQIEIAVAEVREQLFAGLSPVQIEQCVDTLSRVQRAAVAALAADAVAATPAGPARKDKGS